MKQAAPYNLIELTCSQCHQPFDLDIIELPNGTLQPYLQCWNCLRSIPVATYPTSKILVEVSTSIIRAKSSQNQTQKVNP